MNGIGRTTMAPCRVSDPFSPLTISPFRNSWPRGSTASSSMLDGAWTPVDEIEQPRHRALSLALRLPDRVIIEQRSAAWVWGALPTAPAASTSCAPRPGRGSAPGDGLAAGARGGDRRRRDLDDRSRPRHLPDPHDRRPGAVRGRRSTTSSALRCTSCSSSAGLVGRRLHRDHGRAPQPAEQAPRPRAALVAWAAAPGGLCRVDPVHVVDRVDAAHRVDAAGPGGSCRPSRTRTG